MQTADCAGGKGRGVPIAETAHCSPHICCCRSSSGSRGAAGPISPFPSLSNPPLALRLRIAVRTHARTLLLVSGSTSHILLIVPLCGGGCAPRKRIWGRYGEAGRRVKVGVVKLAVSSGSRLGLEVRGAETSETWPRPGSVPPAI
jgi:hypothetical protein